MMNRLREFTRFYLVAIVSGVLLLSATIYIFLAVKNRVDHRNAQLFELRSEAATRVIEKRLYDYIQILKGGQGLFRVSDTVTQAHWHRYISSQEVSLNYPGILGIGYAEMVPPNQKEAFETRLRKDAYSDFTIWNNAAAQAPEQEVLSAIIYLEPLSPANRKAIGYNMYSDPTRRAAMNEARDTARPALSEDVTLVQEEGNDVQKGFLIYLPIYQGDTVPTTQAERRRLIKGFVYSPFRATDLMQGTLGTRFSEIDIEVYDGQIVDPIHLLYDKEISYSLEEGNQALNTQKSIKVGNHHWVVRVAALPHFGYDTSFPWVLLAGGLIITALLTFAMVFLADARQSAYVKQVITDNATAALFIVNRSGDCIFMNPAAERLTGYRFAELEGQNFHQYLHFQYPDGSPYPDPDCPLTKILPTYQSLYDHEEVFYKSSGTAFYASVNTQPLLEKGLLMGHLLEVYDVTAEKEAEEALHQKNRMLETLNALGTSLSAELELPKLLQLITDASVQLISAGCASLFYLENEHEITTYTPTNPRTQAFPVSPRQALYQHIISHSRLRWSDDLSQDAELAALRVDSIRSFIGAPVRLRSGEVVGALFYGHPMPQVFGLSSVELIQGIAAQAAVAIENSRLFETIRQKNQELTSINADLDNFVYSASHDLKAPVLNIEGLIKALEGSVENPNPERQAKVLDMIRQSVNRFKGTIESLSEVAKTNKNIKEDIREIDLPKKLQEVLESISDMVKQSNATVEADLNCTGLRFTPAYTRSILQNLITNAIKYRHPSRPPHIKISCQVVQDFYVLSVADNGLGIPPQYQEKLFTMFKRFHAHVEGSGVGLYLVRRILENNGGRIEVESTEGEGTTFRVYFPHF